MKKRKSGIDENKHKTLNHERYRVLSRANTETISFKEIEPIVKMILEEDRKHLEKQRYKRFEG